MRSNTLVNFGLHCGSLNVNSFMKAYFKQASDGIKNITLFIIGFQKTRKIFT